MLKIGAIAVLLAAIAVPTALFATQSPQETKARINAYKHEDGRIEFAIQVRDGDEWGDRILPRGRILRTTAPTGRWLSSRPVTLPTGPSVRLPITTSEYYWFDGDYRHNRGYFVANRNNNDLGRFITDITVSGTVAYNEGSGVEERETPTLHLSCYEPLHDEGGFSGSVSTPRDAYPDSTVVFTAEQFSWDGYGGFDSDSVADTSRWEVTATDDNRHSLWRISQERMLELKGFHRLTVGYYDEDGNVFIVQFSLERAFGTPVQPNLDHCGEY